MSTNKTIQHKRGTPSNWAKATNYIPPDGELIIYRGGGLPTQIKMGDGKTLVGDLPFITMTPVQIEELVNSLIGEGGNGLSEAEVKKLIAEALAEFNPPESGGGLTEDEVSALITKGTADLQTKEDNNLATTDKTIVGAINEIKASIPATPALSEVFDTDVKLSSVLKTYYKVGKIQNASGTNPVIIGNKGDTLRTVFNNLFNMDEIQPSITQNPSVSCSFSSNASDERGTTISSISYTITFEDGAYTNSSTTGAKMTSYSFSSGTASSSTTNTGTLTLPNTYIVGTSAAFSSTLTVNHSAGEIAKTNLGNNSNPVVQIGAGNVTTTPSFSKAAVDYPYYISKAAATIEDLKGKTIDKKTQNLVGASGETCNYNANAYVWIFIRKGNLTSQPVKTIQAYSEIAKEWGSFLGGTELKGEITFTKANEISDIFYAYRTLNTAGAADSVKFRLN